MVNLHKRFSTAYGRLCHFVAIRKDTASVTAAEDGVIRAAIYLCEGATAPDINEVGENAKAFFSLAFSPEEIERSIGRLISAGQAKANSDSSVSLLPGALAEIAQCVDASARLESSVRVEWLESLRGARLLPEAHEDDEVWRALQHYLAAMFTRHGVQTLEVLAPAAITEETLDSPASDILDDIVKSDLSRMSVRTGKKLIQSFLKDRTPLRNRYLAELLDGTFSFFALTVDDETRRLLRENLPPLKLFVDTNFIFGLLELHSNPFVAISKQLADLIREQNFPFQLYYHPITAIEFKSVIEYYHRRLIGGRWSSSMSRALLRVGELSSVERRFHEINAVQSITVDDFFARYSNLDRLLGPVGIKPYRINYEAWLTEDYTLNLISKYKQYLGERDKPFSVLQHDIILWRTLQSVRQGHPGPFGAGAFFLTCDYTFWRFDHRALSRGATGASVLPNVLLQLLRPFVPRTDNFDRSFVSTFALPEFRTIHSASAQAVSRVAGIVRLYSDLPDDVAVAILTDEVLIAKVVKLDESDPAINELIESAIAAEATRWREEAAQLREALEIERQNSQDAAASLSDATLSAEEKARALNAVTQQLEQERRERHAAEAAVAAEQERLKLAASQHASDVQHLTQRVDLATASEQQARADSARALSNIQQSHSAETIRLKQVLFSLLHILFALGAGTLVVRYLILGVPRFNAVVSAATAYTVIAVVNEWLPYFRTVKQRALARLLWGASVALGLSAWWYRGDAGTFGLLVSIFGSAIIALVTTLFQREERAA